MRSDRVHILGGGAIGFTLAVHLIQQGKSVTVIRTSSDEVPQGRLEVVIETVGGEMGAGVETVSLARLGWLDGIAVVTAKSYANPTIAAGLAGKGRGFPVVILQNGINVERPYLEAGFPEVYRCVLYATAQKTGQARYAYRAVASSPIGPVRGGEEGLARVVDSLHTEGFPFHAQPQIETEVWKKAIINAVFNSVCPLLEADNGIFQRDPACAGLAREIVRECLGVARGLGLELGEAQVMEQLLVISKKSDGQQISTLQDLNHGRLTEIESLNLEIARLAARLEPPVPVHKTRLLGEMVRLKSELRRGWVNSAPSRMIWAEVHPQQQDH